jgi:RNA polymerase sigma-70 factor (ECF subfamily)
MDQADTRAANQTRLRQFIEGESEALLRTLRVYIARSGLASGEAAVRSMAGELLSDTVVEALGHAERFDGTRQPIAWLLGIAANLVRRRQDEVMKRIRREPLARDMAREGADALSDDELFGLLATHAAADPGDGIEAEQGITALLDRLSEEDRRVVRMAVLHDLDGAALARELGIQPGAARVRLHRALGRLRQAAVGLGVSNV